MGCKDSKQAGAEVDGPSNSVTGDNKSSTSFLGGSSIGGSLLGGGAPKIDVNMDRDEKFEASLPLSKLKIDVYDLKIKGAGGGDKNTVAMSELKAAFPDWTDLNNESSVLY